VTRSDIVQRLGDVRMVGTVRAVAVATRLQPQMVLPERLVELARSKRQTRNSINSINFLGVASYTSKKKQ
jgi:hypothetical protein